MDRNVGTNGRGFARYSHRYVETAPLQSFPDDLAIAEGRVIQENRTHNFVAEYNHTLGAATLLTARLGFARTLFVFDNQGLGFVPSSLGLPASIDTAVDRMMFPAIGATNYVPLGGSDHRQRVHELSGARQPDAHDLTAHAQDGSRCADNSRERLGGARGRHVQLLARDDAGPNPNTASSTAGNAVASLLLGTGTANSALIQNWKSCCTGSSADVSKLRAVASTSSAVASRPRHR